MKSSHLLSLSLIYWQLCYNIKEIPQGEWFCNFCEKANRDPELTAQCHFCGLSGGGMVETIDGTFVHKLCVLAEQPSEVSFKVRL